MPADREVSGARRPEAPAPRREPASKRHGADTRLRSPAALLLSLQTSAGNGAVQRLIEGGAGRRGSLQIQRFVQFTLGGDSYRADEQTIGTVDFPAPKAAEAQRPGPLKKPEQLPYGFVATVPKYADKPGAAEEVADLYAVSFQDPAKQSYQLRLVVGLNRIRALPALKPEDAARAAAEIPVNVKDPAWKPLEDAVADPPATRGFGWAKFGYLWEPAWTVKPPSGPAMNLTNRPALLEALLLSARKQRNAANLRTELEQLPEVDRTLASRQDLPYGMFRSKILDHRLTRESVEALKREGVEEDRIFVHVSDPDSPVLAGRAPEKEKAGMPGGGLFERLEYLLARRERKRGKAEGIPDIVSGGYLIVLGRSRGAEGDELTELTTNLDMDVRRILSKADPLAAYYPEPNALIRFKAVARPEGASWVVTKELFGTRGGEMKTAKAKILAPGIPARPLEEAERKEAKRRATFKPEAAVATGAEKAGARFKPDPLSLPKVWEEYQKKPPSEGEKALVKEEAPVEATPIRELVARIFEKVKLREAQLRAIVDKLLAGAHGGKTAEDVAFLTRAHEEREQRRRRFVPGWRGSREHPPTPLPAPATLEGAKGQIRSVLESGGPEAERLRSLALVETYLMLLTTPEQAHFKPLTLEGILLRHWNVQRAATKAEIHAQASSVSPEFEAAIRKAYP